MNFKPRYSVHSISMMMGLRKEILMFPVKPQTRISKNGKIQELVAEKTPNIPDPIRGMLSHERFTISEIL